MKCDPLSYHLFNKSMLVMYEFIECDFEDDFGFHKCLIHTYDMRHILKYESCLMLQSYYISLNSFCSPRFIYQRGESSE